jgi:hypothetical protein
VGFAFFAFAGDVFLSAVGSAAWGCIFDAAEEGFVDFNCCVWGVLFG